MPHTQFQRTNRRDHINISCELKTNDPRNMRLDTVEDFKLRGSSNRPYVRGFIWPSLASCLYTDLVDMVYYLL